MLELHSHVSALSGTTPLTASKNPLDWGHPWFPLLALREMEDAHIVGKRKAKRLKATCPKWEWAVGTYLWLTWTNKMREVHGDSHATPESMHRPLRDVMLTPPNL